MERSELWPGEENDCSLNAVERVSGEVKNDIRASQRVYFWVVKSKADYTEYMLYDYRGREPSSDTAPELADIWIFS